MKNKEILFRERVYFRKSAFLEKTQVADCLGYFIHTGDLIAIGFANNFKTYVITKLFNDFHLCPIDGEDYGNDYAFFVEKTFLLGISDVFDPSRIKEPIYSLHENLLTKNC